MSKEPGFRVKSIFNSLDKAYRVIGVEPGFIGKRLFASLDNLYERLYGVDLTGSTNSVRETMHNSLGTETTPSYALNNAKTLNTTLTRNIYRNRDNKYALAGQLTKPIIDNLVAFTGIPRFITENKKLKAVYDEFEVPYRNVHRMAVRDADCYVWPQWQDDNVEFVVIPPEVVTETWIDPITKKVIGYLLKERVVYSTPKDKNAIADIQIAVTAETITKSIIIEGNPTSSNIFPNPFKVLPIIHFSNDKEPFELKGHSELENIEPILKFYHDMTLDAGITQKRDGRPKTKVTTSMPGVWIDNNFGSGTWDLIKAGQAKLSMQDRDLFINKENENVEYIESNKATGDYAKLSEIAFINLIEGSQTPEIIFGANLGTNLAAAVEQRPIWKHRVERNQNQFKKNWDTVLKLAFKIYGFATFSNLNREFELEWPDPDFASTKEKADSLNIMSNALFKLKQGFMMGDEEIFNTLKKYKLLVLEDKFEKHDKQITDSVDVTAERTKKVTPVKETIANTGANDDDAEDDPAADGKDDPGKDTEVDNGKENG